MSGHKYGYARPSAAILLLKSKDLISEKFYPSSVAYLPGGQSEEFGLSGSKPAIGFIDLHFNVTSWGKQGYRDIVETTFSQKEKLIAELRKFPGLNIFDSQDTPIFLITGENPFLKKFSKGLRDAGWGNSVHYPWNNKRASIRIVVRKHFSDEYIKKCIGTVGNII